VKVAPDGFSASGSDTNKLDANITAFRVADDRIAPPSSRRGLARVLIGLLVAGIIVGAGAAWTAYGEEVKPLIESFTPQISATIGSTWAMLSEKLGLSGEQGAPPAQSATADTPAQQEAVAQPSALSAAATSAPPAAAPAPAAAAPMSADVGQMLQGMAHDIASLQQGIDQLKAGQEQMARDNARLAEQLKASQEQMSRVVARASEASMHPRPPLPAPKPPLVTAARRPLPAPPASTLPPPQTIAPPAQPQVQGDDQLPSALRPPKPVP
jgi:hypothetical protein